MLARRGMLRAAGQVRGIFMKERDSYNPKDEEERQLLLYIRNYMDIDPRKLNEQQRTEIMAKAKEFMQSDMEENKAEPKEKKVVEEKKIEDVDSKFLDAQKLKDIFDKMTLVDTNPMSQESKKFDERLQEVER